MALPDHILLDEHGFLRQCEQWTPAIAATLAREENLTLTDEHLDILALAQRYFAEYGTSPGSRLLVRYVRREMGETQGNSAYLMRLFGGRAARTISRLAGLPKPEHCL